MIDLSKPTVQLQIPDARRELSLSDGPRWERGWWCTCVLHQSQRDRGLLGGYSCGVHDEVVHQQRLVPCSMLEQHGVLVLVHEVGVHVRCCAARKSPTRSIVPHFSRDGGIKRHVCHELSGHEGMPVSDNSAGFLCVYRPGDAREVPSVPYGDGWFSDVPLRPQERRVGPHCRHGRSGVDQWQWRSHCCTGHSIQAQYGAATVIPSRLARPRTAQEEPTS